MAIIVIIINYSHYNSILFYRISQGNHILKKPPVGGVLLFTWGVYWGARRKRNARPYMKLLCCSNLGRQAAAPTMTKPNFNT